MSASLPPAPHIVVFNHVENILKLIEVNLAAHGYHVAAYHESMLDVERVLEPVPNLIILGYLHGAIDDQLGILKTIRQDKRTRHVPIIICPTGALGTGDMTTVLSDGNVQIVEKPFSAQALLAAVHKALG